MKTELEVVNFLLGVMGDSPVADLVTTQHPHVVVALKRLNDAMTEVQKTAWWFNQEYKFEMTPDETTKEISVPLNVMSVECISDRGIIKRGTKMYNAVTHSYQFDNSIWTNQLVKLEIELLEEIVIDAVAYFAAYLVSELDMEDSIKANTMANLYAKSLADMRKEDLKAQRRNALNSPTAARIVAGARYRGRTANPYIPGGGF